MPDIADIQDTSSISLRVTIEMSQGTRAAAPLFRNVQTQSLGDAFATVTSLDESTEIGGDGLPSKGFPTDRESQVDFVSYLNQSDVNDIFIQLYTSNTWTEKATVIGLNANANTTITTVTATTIVGSAGTFTNFRAGDICITEGFNSSGNNGLVFVLAADATSTTLTVPTGTTLIAETGVGTASPRANVTVVGHRFVTDNALSVVVPSTGYPYLSRIAGSKDLSQLGLQEGEVIFIGGDDETNHKGYYTKVVGTDIQ